MNKRNFIKSAAILPVIGISNIKNVYSCSMGMSLSFVNGIPNDYQMTDVDNHYIPGVIRKYLGRTDWEYANNNYFIKAPEISEQIEQVTVSVLMDKTEKEIRFEKLVIIAEKQVRVLRTKERNKEIPNKNGQVPLNFKPDTINAAKPMWVASYIFSQPVYSVSMRLNLTGFNQARILGLLVPADKSMPIQVIKQEGSIRFHPSCDSVIYVDSPTLINSGKDLYYF